MKSPTRHTVAAMACLAAGSLPGCRMAPTESHVDLSVTGEKTSAPLVVAHYFLWFQTPDGRGSWRMWEWGGPGPARDPERMREDGRRDIASVFTPRIGPYDSSDPAVMEYHILSAKLAGIDGFVVDWYGRPFADDALMMPLLDLAQRLDFRVGVCFEDKAMFGYAYHAQTREEAERNAIENLAYVLDRYGAHPAGLRLDGRPVVVNFSWTEPDARVSSQGFSAVEWRRILAAVRERHGLLFLHDFHGHLRESYWDVADNVYPWLDVNGPHRERFHREALERLAAGRIDSVAALVYPGFDNTGVWGWGDGPFVTPREEGALYRRLWEEALQHPLRLVQIATWNDFGEGATIEPTEEYGFQYLELTQHYAARLKNGPAPDPAVLRLPEDLYRQRLELRRSPDTAHAQRLDQAAAALGAGRIEEARRMLAEVAPSPP